MNAPFRFMNYVDDKPEFLPLVQQQWRIHVEGFKMFQKMTVLKEKLTTAQAKVDSSPHNFIVKEEEAKVLLEYKEDVNDESKILYQKAKTDCLREGDKNSTYLHKVIKRRRMANKIVSVCDENGNLVKSGLVATQFVKHFQGFLSQSQNVEPITDIEDPFTKKLTSYLLCEGRKLVELDCILPVRYLGVPLITKTISLNDYKQLVDKVRCIVHDWKNKALSYADRLQLVASVLAAMQLIRPHIIHKIRNGKKVSMWYDNWSDIGPLDQYISIRDIYDARLSAYADVADVINNGRWKWPKEWLQQFLLLQQILVPALQHNSYYVWQERNNKTFANETRNAKLLLELISEKIRLKLMSLKVKASTQVLNVANE
ncbi:hypothetical protein Tco_1162796 [Tanacetum coccineum]